ncbi:MAG TPA: hypothetical protein VK663_04805 [Burkholderiales bacterium]|nr:hypothetical protein [Burkholderiales bacterium]
MDNERRLNRPPLTAAYYLSLALVLPGAALAVLAYLLRGTLGDTFHDIGKVVAFLGKIDDLFPRDWGWQWGFSVLVLLFLASLATIIFMGVAGTLNRYRAYAATILFAVAAVSLSTLVRSEGVRATEIAWICFVITPISMTASGYVIWKAWLHT